MKFQPTPSTLLLAVEEVKAALLVGALSSSILPPAELLIAVLAMVALVLVLLRRVLVKLHSRLQIALIETLQSEKESR